jgi:hypothetical protein
MTPAHFDASASSTPASRCARVLRTLSARIADRILREIWLVAHDACGKPTLPQYCRILRGARLRRPRPLRICLRQKLRTF